MTTYFTVTATEHPSLKDETLMATTDNHALAIAIATEVVKHCQRVNVNEVRSRLVDIILPEDIRLTK